MPSEIWRGNLYHSLSKFCKRQSNDTFFFLFSHQKAVLMFHVYFLEKIRHIFNTVKC